MIHKKAIAIIIVILAIILTSCIAQDSYETKYPEYFTPRYCYENYIEADPNLVYLDADESTVGQFVKNATSDTYFAIKDISINKYIARSRMQLMVSGYEPCVMKHKDITEEAILSYKPQKAELFWQTIMPYEDHNTIRSIGKNVLYESITSVDAELLQNYILDIVSASDNECIREDLKGLSSISKQYTQQYGSPGILLLTLRVYFSEYDNLAWDTRIYSDGNKYYMSFFVFVTRDTASDGYYNEVFFPLPDNVVALIPSE